MDDRHICTAYSKKQDAYNEMKALQSKLAKLQLQRKKLYYSIEDMQWQYEDAKARQNLAWTEYNNTILGIRAEIGRKIAGINEVARLEANLQKKATNPNEDPAKVLIYVERAKSLERLKLKRTAEKDALIHKKRTMLKPDNSVSHEILSLLKNLRAEHNKLLEECRATKKEYALKKAEFNRLKTEYVRIKKTVITHEEGGE